MKKDSIPTKPWEIMGFAKDFFGLPFMRRLIGVNSDRQVYRQCTNPNMSFGDEPCPSFIDRTAQLLGELEISGSHEAHDVAVNLLTHLSEIIGYEVIKKGEHHPDKETLIEEIYDDFKAYGDLCKSMESEEHPSVTGTLFAKAHDELRQTKTRYTMDFFKKHGHKEKRRSA